LRPAPKRRGDLIESPGHAPQAIGLAGVFHHGQDLQIATQTIETGGNFGQLFGARIGGSFFRACELWVLTVMLRRRNPKLKPPSAIQAREFALAGFSFS
jgi:hypothetical protein